MIENLSLKEIERRAFRSTYQDGLWDLYLGAVVMAMGLFMYHPATGYTAANPIGALLITSFAYSLFQAGKKRITTPRLGQARFGAMRQQKKRSISLVLGCVVVLQLVLLGLTAFAWLSPRTVSTVLPLDPQTLERMVVAGIGALIVGFSMLTNAYFNDFERGYVIALLMGLAVFLMIAFNQPVYPLLIGAGIVLVGLALFIRFLRRYPLSGQGGDEPHG